MTSKHEVEHCCHFGCIVSKRKRILGAFSYFSWSWPCFRVLVQRVCCRPSVLKCPQHLTAKLLNIALWQGQSASLDATWRKGSGKSSRRQLELFSKLFSGALQYLLFGGGSHVLADLGMFASVCPICLSHRQFFLRCSCSYTSRDSPRLWRSCAARDPCDSRIPLAAPISGTFTVIWFAHRSRKKTPIWVHFELGFKAPWFWTPELPKMYFGTASGAVWEDWGLAGEKLCVKSEPGCSQQWNRRNECVCGNYCNIVYYS